MKERQSRITNMEKTDMLKLPNKDIQSRYCDDPRTNYKHAHKTYKKSKSQQIKMLIKQTEVLQV